MIRNLSRLNILSKQMSTKVDPFRNLQLAPPDSIFKLTAAFKQDSFDKKVNLGVGAYRDDHGKPFILPSIKSIKKSLLNDDSVDHEYLPILGLPDFTSSAARLILGNDSLAIKENRVVSAQTISGTGANHSAAAFLSKHYDFDAFGIEKNIYVSTPTWANHHSIFKNVGLEPVNYPYYNSKTIGLDFDNLINALNNAPKGSIWLLHACAHNPTGVDPTPEQWNKIADIFEQRQLFAFFDCAYQGFASGDLNKDAASVRLFIQRRIPSLVCQSFAKNAGLYGERIGALHLIGKDNDETERLRTQYSVFQRAEISNPPAFGARLVSSLLNSTENFNQWEKDIKYMADRIINMRQVLFDLLTNKLKTPSPNGQGWDHIVKQIGMFSFTGLNADQCQKLIDKHHIYLTANGRISMAGLNSSNVEYVANAIDDVIKN